MSKMSKTVPTRGLVAAVLGSIGAATLDSAAAGYELDRADPAPGMSAGAVILARSQGHGPSFIVTPEEILTHIKTVTGGPPRDLVHGGMVYFETPGGGAVFSAGSITFRGARPVDGFDNPVSRLLDNLLRRFKAARVDLREAS